MISDTSYVLLIDTNSYAANFYREMAAYCTGMVGECDTGRQYSDVFYKDMDIEDDETMLADEKNPFDEYVVSRMSSDGYWRPVAPYANPNYTVDDSGVTVKITPDNFRQSTGPAFTSVGLYLEKPLDKRLLNILRERVEKFCKEVYPKTILIGNSDPLAADGFRLLKETRIVEEVSLQVS